MNTSFIFNEHHTHRSTITSEIYRFFLNFRDRFSRQPVFDWYVMIIFGFIVWIDHYGVRSIMRWLGIKSYLY
jgi:hypothetical protein